MPGIDETKPFVPVRFAIITVSDTRLIEDDRSGDALMERVLTAGHQLATRELVTDDADLIRGIVGKLAKNPNIDAIITTGGTGFTGRDVTPEAIEPLFDKRMEGFSTVFHRLSFEKIGASTIQSRATAGLIGGTFVFVLPGSPGACRDGWDWIIGPQFDYRTKPCNFVEIMPRLDEGMRRRKLRGSRS